MRDDTLFSIGHERKYHREEEAKRQIESRQRISKRDVALVILSAAMTLGCCVVSAWWYLAFAK